MLISVASSVLLFVLVCVGLGWPIAATLTLSATEKFVAAVVLSILGTFLWSWGVYVFALPEGLLWVLPVAAAVGLWSRQRALRALWADPASRRMAGAQLAVSAWCLAWLATITTYSGGGWAGDWFEHWERARFFAERWELDRQFIGTYHLTARPPLANIVVGAFLALTRFDFAHFQVFSCLFASLVFAPAALLALRFDARFGNTAGATAFNPTWGLAAGLMFNPLFVQNTTFPWTKMPAALFVLAGLYFFLRSRDSGSLTDAVLSGAGFAAGLLSHYSTAPYIVVVAIAWFAPANSDRSAPRGRSAMVGAATVAAIASTWFGWALSKYGWTGTLLTTTTVTTAAHNAADQALVIALNVVDTVVPHFLRTFDRSLIAQSSPWGAARDWFFQCYQLNLPLAFGSIASVVLFREVARVARVTARRAAIASGCLVGAVVLLGIGAHSARDHWGLAHICLQPLIVAGLAFLAARVSTMTGPWQLALIGGATIDFLCGILLHFAVQSFALDSLFAPGRSAQETFMSYSLPAVLNLRGKVGAGLRFLSDELGTSSGMVIAFLGLAGALLLSWLARAASRRPPRRFSDAFYARP